MSFIHSARVIDWSHVIHSSHSFIHWSHVIHSSNDHMSSTDHMSFSHHVPVIHHMSFTHHIHSLIHWSHVIHSSNDHMSSIDPMSFSHHMPFIHHTSFTHHMSLTDHMSRVAAPRPEWGNWLITCHTPTTCHSKNMKTMINKSWKTDEKREANWCENGAVLKEGQFHENHSYSWGNSQSGRGWWYWKKCDLQKRMCHKSMDEQQTILRERFQSQSKIEAKVVHAACQNTLCWSNGGGRSAQKTLIFLRK